MNEFFQISTPLAAFIAGLVTSFHCAGMCGPLCGLICSSKSVQLKKYQDDTALFIYQIGRVVSYSIIGMALGGVGGGVATLLSIDIVKMLPAMIFLFFVAVILGWDKKGAFSFSSHSLFSRWRQKIMTFPAVLRGGLLGLLTPLLPCGPLYLLFGVCMVSGGWAQGGVFAMCFGLGTLPLLWLTQRQFLFLREKLSQRVLQQVRLGLAATSAVVILLRMVSDVSITDDTANDCPLCIETSYFAEEKVK